MCSPPLLPYSLGGHNASRIVWYSSVRRESGGGGRGGGAFRLETDDSGDESLFPIIAHLHYERHKP